MKEELLKDLDKAKSELNVAHNGYQYAVDKDEIDYYTYSIKAAQCKFTHILKQIRNSEKILIDE